MMSHAALHAANVLQGALLEQLNMSVVGQVFDALALGFAEACAARPHLSSTPTSPDARGRALRLAPALSPQVLLLTDKG